MKALSIILIAVILAGVALAAGQFPWLTPPEDGYQTIRDIPVPDGFTRVEQPDGSFGAWLRTLPLKPEGAQVHLFDGSLKANKSAHYRVIDIDVGARDLQQCADAVMRLRAEYFFSLREWDSIAFDFTNGDRVEYAMWRDGIQPGVAGADVMWLDTQKPDTTYAGFRQYLDAIFMYAGSYSLERELKPVASMGDIQPGDVFIQGGFPGHAIVVVDVARRASDSTAAFIVAQGFTPAQEFHVLRNNVNTEIDPWYIAGSGDRLKTPEWTFDWTDLRRF